MKHNFRNLEIWKRSRLLVKKVYSITIDFPNEEIFGLTSQIRRSAVSIPTNIAEGCGRNSTKELQHFLNIAIGSLCELESLLIVSLDLNFIEDAHFNEFIFEVIEIRKMVSGFRKSLNQ